MGEFRDRQICVLSARFGQLVSDKPPEALAMAAAKLYRLARSLNNKFDALSNREFHEADEIVKLRSIGETVAQSIDGEFRCWLSGDRNQLLSGIVLNNLLIRI